MQIFNRVSGLVLAVALAAAASASTAGTVKYKSAGEALNQGVSAYNGGYYEIALPALDYAANEGEFLAQYYLARMYADNSWSNTNHAKAYELYQHIADENTDVDPDDDARAPFVGKALTALAGYVRTGLPENGLKPDIDRAVEYLRHAATFFRDEDAQFELSKLQLKGEGMDPDVPSALNWLATLSKKGHAGAQAFLADLYWRGKFVEQDKVKAFALIRVAVANAPQTERLWIEDIYQNIFCGAGEGIRKQADGLVGSYFDRYGRKPAANERSPGLGPLNAEPVRTCENGEAVPAPIAPSDHTGVTPDAAKKSQASEAPQPRDGAGFARGGTMGGSLRDIGATFVPNQER